MLTEQIGKNYRKNEIPKDATRVDATSYSLCTQTKDWQCGEG